MTPATRMPSRLGVLGARGVDTPLRPCVLDPLGLQAAGSGPGGEVKLSLEAILDATWEGLTATGAATCPVCRGRMTRPPAHREGACDTCGSHLS